MIPTHRPYLGRAELDAVARVFDSRWLGLGPRTAEFEAALCAFLGVKHVIAVNSGTAALHLALAVLDLQPGDEVILPSLTFASAAQVVLAAGATPVFCEVCPDSLNIDVHDALSRVSARTKVIMPLHYGGYACAMDELLCAARARGLSVVEDGAHAFGSSYRGRMVGTLGDLTCFSFDPIKNITCGGGGAIATDRDELARRMLPLHNLGFESRSWTRRVEGSSAVPAVVTPGYRYHLADLNAAIGLEQLKQFPAFKARRQEIVRRYDEAFAAVPGLSLLRHDVEASCPFSYVVRVPAQRRSALRAYLTARGIETLVQFTPNHLHLAFASARTPLPVTEALHAEILSLPLYYELTAGQLETVIAAVLAFFADPLSPNQ